MESRAYSILEIKSADDEQWVVEGIASTPTPDAYGDIVEPLGAKFTLPMPLLWQHRADKPVGEVTFARPNKSGIPFRARILKASEFTSETLRERALEAWESVKTGLVKAVSIGFSADEYSFLKEGGVHFTKWTWRELSLVTIPANTEATISSIKSICDEQRAALGHPAAPDRPIQPGASGIKSVQIIKPKPKEATVNIADQIKDLEATLAAKREERNGIQEKVSKEGRTKDESEREAFDTLGDEIKALSQEISDLRELEKENAAQAKAVDTTPTQKAATDSRGPKVYVEREEKLEPGIEFARFAMCLAAAKGDVSRALNLAKTHYPKNQRILNVLRSAGNTGSEFSPYMGRLITRDAVAAGTTSQDTWAEPLVEYNQFAGDFVNYLRPMTLIGQFGQNGVPDFRRIPFNVHIRGQTSGGSGYWVGQGKPKPVTKFDFNDTYHGFYKLAAISVITDELIRFSDPSAERLVRDGLAEAIIETMDGDFIDSTNSGIPDVKPASITNGVNGIASSGDDVDAVRTDINALWAAAIAANLPLGSAVYITTPSIALALSLMVNSLEQVAFPGVNGPQGGTFLGRPLITSNHVPAGEFILAFASELYLSDDGAVTVDASREASIEMLDSSLVQDATAGTGTSLVSMYQTNSVALRAERFINWSKRRSTAVARLTGVGWNGAVES